MICDLAETYHVFNYRSLPARLVATFVVGLPDESRIKRKLSGQKHATSTIFQAAILDELRYIKYALTGGDQPKSVLNILIGADDENKVDTFASGEDFKNAWRELTNE